MKIVQLTAVNVRILKAAHIDAPGNVIVIKGKNAQGKTAVLKSIMYALGGKEYMDKIPIREGEEYAQIVLDLEKFLVTRNLSKTDLGYKQSVIVSSKDGARYPSPQGLLDKLLEGKAFDPLEFSRLKDQEQQQMLAGLLKLDFTKFISEKVRLEEDRRVVGRDVTRLKSNFAIMLKPESNLPELPIDESENTYLAEYEALVKKEKDNSELTTKIAVINTEIEAFATEVTALTKQINEINNRLKLISTVSKDKFKKRDELKNQLVEVNPDEYNTIKLKSEETKAANKILNEKIKYRDNFVAIENELSDKVVEYNKYSLALADLGKAKMDYIASCEYPIEGLQVTETDVLYHNLPFSQASESEKLKVSLAIVEAFKNDLRICLIKDGSLLDTESMEYLCNWADASGIQVWIEKVADENDDPTSIYIEDGEIIPFKVIEGEGEVKVE